MLTVDNDLLSMQKARILAENAFEARKLLAAWPQERLDVVVEGVAEAVSRHVRELADMSHEETEYGRPEDKLVKDRFACERIAASLRGMRCVGVIGEDRARRILDIGVPVGVVVALCPATSPVSTTIATALIAIKSGNAVIFSPHPRALRTMGRTLDIMIEAAQSLGLPEGCLSYLSTVATSGTLELMNHKATSMILVTGVPGMLRAAHGTGKPVIFGGTGNGPAFIERTADIDRAVRDIVASKTFDNGVCPSAEQSVVVETCISDQVRAALRRNGAYFMTDEESKTLAAHFFGHDGRPRPGVVGRSAAFLARKAGIAAPDGVTVLIADRKYVSEEDPYAREMLSPVLAYYMEDDWMHACEKCIELLLHEKSAHTLVIHSNDEDVIRQFALKKPVGRLLVNTPATFGGMGATTNLFPAMTLGSGSAGFGITADNVSPLNLIYTRKVGYGVRTMDTPVPGIRPADQEHLGQCSPRMRSLHRILSETIQVLEGPADR